MSLKALYERFLARPESELLSADATLNYITTTTTVSGADAVAKHLLKQNSTVAKKAEKVLSAVEGPNSLCLDVELTAEFLTGGGAYLLTLDENFLIGHVVTFPLIHIVQFDSENKISQIRLYWDQGSLLKQVEVIGSRNWPIRDGPAQARLISASVAAVRSGPIGDAGPSHGRSNNSVDDSVPTRSRSPSKKATKDPHASLSLFESLSMEDGPDTVPATPAATRGSARPPPRDYNEIFGETDPDVTPTKTADPSKRSATNKGAGHGHKTSRIFGEEDDEVMQTPGTASKTFSHFEFGEGPAPPEPTPASKRNTNSKPHSHFEFGEAEVPLSPEKPSPVKSLGHFEFGEEEHEPLPETRKTAMRHERDGHPFAFGEEIPESLPEPKKNVSRPSRKDDRHFEFGDEPQPAPAPTRSSRHMSQWDFEDFANPEEPAQKPPAPEIRHFGWEDENDVMNTPQNQPRVHKGRRDAETHFTIQDEDTPGREDEKKPTGRVRGSAHNKGLKLYENNLYDESGDPPEETQQKPHSIAALNGSSRKKDFDSHWVMTDEPALNVEANKQENKPIASDRMKAVKMMDSNWEMNDDEFDANQQKPVAPAPSKRFSRNVNQRNWSFGDDDM